MILANARLVAPDGVSDAVRIDIRGELVLAVGALADVTDAPVFDLRGHYVVPGLVDMHCHGGGGHSYPADTVDDAYGAARFAARNATTTTIASLVTAPLPVQARAVARLAELVEASVLAGIHLEGPFLARSHCGAHDPNLLLPPTLEVLKMLLDAGRGAIRMITIAPELPGALDAIRYMCDRGVTAAIGHTGATYAQTVASFDAGASVATHLFNAMAFVHHREPGPVVAALVDDRITIEIINDGIHLDPAIVRLVFRAAPGRVALITDAMAGAGLPDGRYRLGYLPVDVRDGGAYLAGTDAIAGSTMTMPAAIRNTVHAGVSLHDAVTAATLTPARALGLAATIGTLGPGTRADLVVLSHDLAVAAVMIGGEWASDARAWLSRQASPGG